MEDDGTVNMKKEPMQQRQQSSTKQREEEEEDDEPTPTSTTTTSQSLRGTRAKSPSLAQLLNKNDGNDEDGKGNDATVGSSSGKSVDLKELLPKQKMRFLKLDVSTSSV